MAGEKWLLGVIVLIGLGVAISQCSNGLDPTRSSSGQGPKVEHNSAITEAPQASEEADSQGLKRQWARADRLCRFDDDELVRARNCAFRSQIERELERQGKCHEEEQWRACPRHAE